MNVISFSLYGDNPRYLQGALRNVELAKKYYPGWECVFSIPWENSLEPITGQLLANGGKIFRHLMTGEVPPMFWRFLVADNPNVDRFIVRDADSRIGPEEAAAVAEWIKDDTVLHTCRSHPAHCRPINGGMWGAMWRRPNWSAPSMSELIQDYLTNEGLTYTGHDHDQHFLCTKIWPWAKSSCTQHSSVCLEAYPGSKPFPMKWQWPRFMGEVYEIDAEGNEMPRDGDWQQISKEEE